MAKKIIEVEVITEERPRYAKICTLAKLFDMDRTTVWRYLGKMREAGVYHKAVIADGPKTKRVNIDLFEQFLRSRSLKYLKA